MCLILFAIIFLTTIDEIYLSNATLFPIFGRIGMSSAWSLCHVDAIVLPVFTRKLHVTLVNCVGTFYMRFLGKDTAFPGNFARASFTRNVTPMVLQGIINESSMNDQWNINVTETSTVKSLMIINVSIKIISLSSMLNRRCIVVSLMNMPVVWWRNRWIINVIKVFLIGEVQ